MFYKMSKVAASALALVMVNPANATTHYTFSGTINDVRDFAATDIATYIPFGTTFSGSFDYDPDAKISYYIDSNRAVFQAPISPVSTVIGNYTFDKGRNELQVLNGNPGLYFLSSDQSDFTGLPASLNGFSILTRIQLYGGINDLVLPQTLSLNSFPGFVSVTGYSLAGGAPSYFSWRVAGNLTELSATAVPEPVSWMMMIVGFGMVGATARYRRRSSKATYA